MKGIKHYLKNVKEEFKRTKDNPFEVDLQAPFDQFIFAMKDGGHYFALDINVVVKNRFIFYDEQFKRCRILISEYILWFFEEHLKIDNPSLAAKAEQAISDIKHAKSNGQVTIVPVNGKHDLAQLGLNSKNTIDVIVGTYLKKQVEIQKQFGVWKKVVFIVDPNDVHSFHVAKEYGLDTYIL